MSTNVASDGGERCKPTSTHSNEGSKAAVRAAARSARPAGDRTGGGWWSDVAATAMVGRGLGCIVPWLECGFFEAEQSCRAGGWFPRLRERGPQRRFAVVERKRAAGENSRLFFFVSVAAAPCEPANRATPPSFTRDCDSQVHMAARGPAEPGGAELPGKALAPGESSGGRRMGAPARRLQPRDGAPAPRSRLCASRAAFRGVVGGAQSRNQTWVLPWFFTNSVARARHLAHARRRPCFGRPDGSTTRAERRREWGQWKKPRTGENGRLNGC